MTIFVNFLAVFINPPSCYWWYMGTVHIEMQLYLNPLCTPESRILHFLKYGHKSPWPFLLTFRSIHKSPFILLVIHGNSSHRNAIVPKSTPHSGEPDFTYFLGKLKVFNHWYFHRQKHPFSMWTALTLQHWSFPIQSVRTPPVPK